MNNYQRIFLAMVLFSLSFCDVIVTSSDVGGIKIVLLTNESNIIIHDRKQPFPKAKNIHVRDRNLQSVINITIHPNFQIQITLRIKDAVDEYKEVRHSDDDNQFILQSRPGSDTFHLHDPLKYVTANYCARPLPSEYLIIKDAFKNRATLSYPEWCTREKRTHTACSHIGQRYFRRSVNDQCTWKINGRIVVLDDDLKPLPQNLNSIYCVENSQLLIDLFKEKVKGNEKIIFNPECEFAKARCVDCQVLRCRSKRSCCHTSAECLLNENCLKFYSVECYDSVFGKQKAREPRCMRGSTFKFTLTPRFNFDKKHFLCHLERQTQRASITGQITAKVMLPHSQTIGLRNFKASFSDSDSSIFPNFKFILTPSSMEKMDKIIFERRGYEYFVHSLKRSVQMDTSPPTRHEHFTSEYLKVQFQTPFQHTTGKWSKETCHMNTSDIYRSQPIHDNRTTVPVRLLQKPFKTVDVDGVESFNFNMVPVLLDAIKIRPFFLERSSILDVIFCNQSAYFVSSSFALGLQLAGINSWILHIQGDFIEKSPYFTVSITDIRHPKDPIFHSDVVVTKVHQNTSSPQKITLSLLISLNQSTTITQIQVVIFHCSHMLHKQFLFLKPKDLSLSKSDSENSNPKDISNFLLTFFLSIISACFVYFLLLAFQAMQRSAKVSQMRLNVPKKRMNKRLNTKLLLKVIFYLTLKLFYIVSFTLSLVLSMCLSLNSIWTYSNTSHHTPFGNITDDIVKDNEFRNLTCEYKSKELHDGFLIKTAKLLSNNEYIRTQSHQSTYSSMISMIKQHPINRTKMFVDNFITSAYDTVEERLKILLGIYINVFEEIKETKWLQIFTNWNTTVTVAVFDYEFLNRYLKIFNLLRINAATAMLENCVIFTQSLSKIHKRNEIFVNMKPFTKTASLSIPSSRHVRYFINNNERIYAKVDPKKQEEKIKKIIHSVDIVKIRIVFMLIDTMLIIYRFYWTFVDIQRMWRPKKKVVQLDQVHMKGSLSTFSNQLKPGVMQWSKAHHLECLISGHLIIAAIIIIMSIVCTNLIVLLTSREHSHWLSKISGNLIRIRSLKNMKERISHFNAVNIVPIRRHWEYMNIIKIKEIMSRRTISSQKMMNLELFFNKYYYYELCHYQQRLSPLLKKIDFCSSMVPEDQMLSVTMCDRSPPSPFALSYSFSSFYTSETIIHVNMVIYFVIHLLAIVILVAAIIGILKIIRKQVGNKILYSDQSTYIIQVPQEQYLNHFKITPTVPSAFASFYMSGTSPHQKYQCCRNEQIERNSTAF